MSDNLLVRQIAFEPATVQEIQAALPSDTTMLVYAIGEPNSVVFLITPTDLQAVILNATTQMLAEYVRAFSADRQTNVAVLGSVYHDVFAPIAPHIETSRLIIAADGPLHYLPIAALQAPNGRYLVDDYIITMTPSATSYALMSRRQTSQSDFDGTREFNALVMSQANPPNQIPLTNTDAEAEQIATLLNTTAILDVTETQLREIMTSTVNEPDEFSILHISGHMTMDQHAPLFSAIQLDPDDQHDGSLAVHELYSLLSEESSMDLVVLSGCDTGRGGTSGEDYGLLVRSFISSGSEGVIASLWSVDDTATSELLTLFYQHLNSGDSESEALQKAMIEVRVQFPDPYYWAAFAYTGRP